MAKITIIKPNDPAISVNSILEGTIALGNDIDIQVTDGSAPVNPTSVTVVDQTVTIEVANYGQLASDMFQGRVEFDSGTFEAQQCLIDAINSDIVSFNDARLLITPNGVKASTLYAIKPFDGVGDLTWTRGSVANRTNSSLVAESTAINVPRINFPLDGGCPHILAEPARTNLYLNSAVLVTQNITTAASTYSVSFIGTGTITFSGTFAGSLVGTGATDRVTITFTTTAGTLTSTVTGSALEANAELGSYPTSWITTAGTSATRSADMGNNSGDVTTFNSISGVLFANIAALTSLDGNRFMAISDGTLNNRINLVYSSASNIITFTMFVGGVNQTTINYLLPDSTAFSKVAIRWALNDFSIWVDGVKRNEDLIGSVYATNTLNTFSLDAGIGTSPFYGKIRKIAHFDYLSDSQMINLTT